MPKLAKCSEKADLKGQTEPKKKNNKVRATGRRSKNED